MSIDSHIETLRTKHENLSKIVERAQRSPGSCDFEIARMKREKLRLKEEIARLGH